jgi:phage gpG-like protein
VIKAWLIGDKEVVAKLNALPANLSERLFSAVTKWALKIEGEVKGSKLSGQALKVQSGTLRRSVTQKVNTDSSGVVAIVGTNVKYAAFHEYGFKGTENVKAHLRTIKKAWGKPLKAGSKQIAVSAHVRRIDYPARSFLRSVLEGNKDAIFADLKAAIGEAVKA